MSRNNNSDKKFKPIFLLPIIILLIIIISIIIFVVLGNKVSIESLLEENFSGQHLASVQKFEGILNIDDNNKNDILIKLEDRRDSDTDHVKVENILPDKFNYEVYITKVDLKYGIYYKKESDEIWNLKFKTKNISEDDVRTDYIENDNEIDLSSVNINAFLDINLQEDDDKYIITGKTNYITTLTILNNIRQVLGVNEYYEKYNNFFTKNASELKVNITMNFDKDTKLLKEIVFESDNDSLKSCIENFKNIEEINLKKFKFTLNNDSYDASDIYVPSEVDLNSIKIE